VPAWSGEARVSVNGKDAEVTRADGYAILRRKWTAGDSVRLMLPMRLRAEPIADDPDLLAFMHGPLVLAADLGAADAPFDAQAPVLVGAQSGNPIAPVTGRAAEYDLASSARPTGLRLVPFFQQYDRRTALYFRPPHPERWEREQSAYAAEVKRVQALDAQAVDIVRLGQAQAESDHELRGVSEPLHYRGRDSRLARKEGWFEFRMKTAAAPLTLQATYGGDERNRRFRSPRRWRADRDPAPRWRASRYLHRARLPDSRRADAGQGRDRRAVRGGEGLRHRAGVWLPAAGAVASSRTVSISAVPVRRHYRGEPRARSERQPKEIEQCDSW
jgi:hypothetical protein